MIRLFGFVLGVGLTVLLFTTLLSRVQIPAPVADAIEAEPETAIARGETTETATRTVDPAPIFPVKLAEGPDRQRQDSPDVWSEAAVPSSSGRTDDSAGIAAEAAPGATMSTASSATMGAETVVPTNIDNDNRAGQQDIADNDTQTHIFWNPFRSAWAARGFARRLSNATQIDIRMVETGQGRYRAAFDYDNDEQRTEYIQRIESTTGLQLQ